MIEGFAANLFEAFRAPRSSARRMVSAAPSMQDCVLMVVLAFALQSLVAEGYVLASGSDALGRGLSGRAVELVVQIVIFFLMTTLVYAVGRRFGGVAEQQEAAAVVAWHTLVSAFLAPLQVLGMSAVNTETGEVGGAGLLVPLTVAISLWLFANFVAEAHGFQRIGFVLVFSIAGFMLLGVVAIVLLGALGPAP